MIMNGSPSQNSLLSVYIRPDESPIEYQRDALAYWQNKRGGRIAPAWSDISLMDFPPRVLPLIAVLDINPETFEMSYRFWGTQLTEMLGEDYTGKTPGDVKPKHVGNGNEDAYREMIEKKIPQLEVKEFFRREILRGRQMVLRLPLSDDGVSVTKSISIFYQEMTGTARPQSEFFDHVLSFD